MWIVPRHGNGISSGRAVATGVVALLVADCWASGSCNIAVNVKFWVDATRRLSEDFKVVAFALSGINRNNKRFFLPAADRIIKRLDLLWRSGVVNGFV